MANLPPWALSKIPAPAPNTTIVSLLKKIDDDVKAVAAIDAVIEETGPIFRTVRGALFSAFRWEVASVANTSRALVDLREDGDRGRGDLSATDMMAQAGLTMRICRETLSSQHWDCICAYYTHAETRTLRQRKLSALNRLLDELKPSAAPCPPKFIVEMALDWSSVRAAKPLSHWAGKYQVTSTTVARWRHGKKEHRHKPGIVSVLDRALDIAHEQLAGPFMSQGLCPWD